MADHRPAAGVLSEFDLEAALPDVTTPQRFSSLRSAAVIRRDRWGIPHIKADDEYDLFFAQGFATAQDRLFQMDFDRLRALGRAAEYLGSRALQQDRLMRRRRIERVSRLDYEIAGSAARNAMDAYADGVNAFIQSTRALPVEYKLLGTRPEPWQPWHCVVVYKLRNTAEGSFQGKLWLARLAAEIGPEKAARLSPGYMQSGLLTVPPGARHQGLPLNAIDELRAVVEASSMLEETAGGSNGWAICGERTQSGLPLVAGDPHRSLETPNVYYQIHLIGSDFSVLGFAIPGVPMALHFCHNEHVAWGMTNANVDTQDLFIEQFRTSGSRVEYLYKGEWRPAACETVTLECRAGEQQTLDIVETHHGPVIAGDPRSGCAMTLADPGSREGTPWLDAAYRAMKARSADELEAALEGWTDRVNNYVYADVGGNFGYMLRGRVPVRTSVNGWGPVAGWNGSHEWQGYVPAAQLPRSRNPDIGWVVSCNQRIVDETYPYFLTHFFGSRYRAERIVQLLSDLKTRGDRQSCKAGPADMSAMHADIVSIPAQSLQKALARVSGLSPKAAAAASILLEWDCKLATDSAGAVLYQVACAKLAELLTRCHYEALARDFLNAADAGAEDHWRRHLRGSIFIALGSGDESWVPPGESWSSLLSKSLEAGVAELENRFGADMSTWRWGELHRTRLQHPLAAVFPDAAGVLNPPSVETAGDGDTPLVSGSKTGAHFVTGFGSVSRYVYDPSNWSNGCWIVPLGASGHPASAHYSDQQQMWAKVEAIPQLWDWDEIGRAAETQQELRTI